MCKMLLLTWMYQTKLWLNYKILSKSKEKSNFEKSKKISSQINDISIEQEKSQKDINILLSNLPNLAIDTVPIGNDEKSNKLIKKLLN